MPIKDNSKGMFITHQLFHGTTWHSRLLPTKHKFAYPYRYWGVNISALAAGQPLPEVNKAIVNKGKKALKLPIFSTKNKALQQFCAADYISNLEANEDEEDNHSSNNSKDDSRNVCENDYTAQALEQRLSAAFIKHTGSAPSGDMMGLVVCRNMGIYFSPVNFYLGFDSEQIPTHLLAEVSNTPWNKRHYYGFLLNGEHSEFCHDKDFHVSPFNPIDQQYCWQVDIDTQSDKRLSNKDAINEGIAVRIAINISDKRGEVLRTGVKMTGSKMTIDSIQQSLRQNPLMNMTSLTRIYWHALKLYAIKKVPYINYNEKLVDSQQQNDESNA